MKCPYRVPFIPWELTPGFPGVCRGNQQKTPPLGPAVGPRENHGTALWGRRAATGVGSKSGGHTEMFGEKASKQLARWWSQIFFIFIPIWGRFPIWLIFFRWVETTNQASKQLGFGGFFLDPQNPPPKKTILSRWPWKTFSGLSSWSFRVLLFCL